MDQLDLDGMRSCSKSPSDEPLTKFTGVWDGLHPGCVLQILVRSTEILARPRIMVLRDNKEAQGSRFRTGGLRATVVVAPVQNGAPQADEDTWSASGPTSRCQSPGP